MSWFKLKTPDATQWHRRDTSLTSKRRVRSLCGLRRGAREVEHADAPPVDWTGRPIWMCSSCNDRKRDHERKAAR